MREVQNKWNTLKLNDDIWAKLIYFERNRRLAKAYVSTPVLTLDGSTNGLDGFRIGLSGIENSYRDLDSMACLCSIGHGIRLKIDSQGNILVRKLAPASASTAPGLASKHQRSCSIWVKEWPASGGGGGGGSSSAPRQHSPSSAGSSSGSSGASDYSQLSASSSGLGSGRQPREPTGWPMYELLDSKSSYKLFDMQKFRAHLETTQAVQQQQQQQKQGGGSKPALAPIDWRQCVSIISFVRSVSAPAGKELNGGKIATTVGLRQPQPQPPQQQVLSDPCWLMLINIIAIDMLKSSVCDSASRPSPSSQTSALINRYEREQQALGGDRRLSARSPRPASSSRLAAMPGGGSMANLAIANQAARSRAPLPPAEVLQARGQQQVSLSSSSAAAPGGGINTNTTSSSSGASSAASTRGGGLQHSRSSQQLTTDGSIYTTFTGKYLDKHQRMRLGAATSGPMGASIDDLRARRLSRTFAATGAPARPTRYSQQQQHQHQLLYPVDSFTGLAQRALPGGARDRYGRLVLLAARHPASRNQPALSHSLSAFDLSHGLKLNLRSMNSTSIKMNFDSDSEDGDEGGHGEQPLVQSTQHVDLVEKLKLKAPRDAPAQRQPQQQRMVGADRKVPRANDQLEHEAAASEWTSLAKKFPLLNFKPIEGRETGGEGEQKLEASDNDKSTVAAAAAAQADVARAQDARPNGASRASIVSSSSSSGCADNDYVVSQSSHSSMSSSTRSHEAEELLFSQPASSSGIGGNCGSQGGNTSDEYERKTRQLRPAAGDAAEGGNKSTAMAATPKKQTDQPQQRLDSELSGTKSAAAGPKKSQDAKDKTRRASAAKLTSNRSRQNISLNRCYNVKTIDFSDNELESGGGGSQPCNVPGHQTRPTDSRCQPYHGTSIPPTSLPELVQCDCGEPNCDQYLVAVGGCPLDDAVDGAPCDCCCDCFYVEADGCDGGGITEEDAPLSSPQLPQPLQLACCAVGAASLTTNGGGGGGSSSASGNIYSQKSGKT